MDDNARILLMDTSGQSGSVGLADATRLLAAEPLPGTMRHAAKLTPMIRILLGRVGWAADSLTDVFLTIGPGSFTGLRLGVSVARTLAWSVGARIVALPTLQVLARNALALMPPPPYVAVFLDAKRGQAFAACFCHEHGGYEPIIDVALIEPAEFVAHCPRPLVATGEGVPMHEQALTAGGAAILDRQHWPGRAEHVYALGLAPARAGRYTPAGELVPCYIRRPEMEERWEQRQARNT